MGSIIHSVHYYHRHHWHMLNLHSGNNGHGLKTLRLCKLAFICASSETVVRYRINV